MTLRLRRFAMVMAMVGLGGPAAGQSAAPPVPTDPAVPWPLPRLKGPIVIDGRSDDPAWQAIPPLPLTQYLPSYGGPPSERTEARVGYDADALYIVIDAF